MSGLPRGLIHAERASLPRVEAAASAPRVLGDSLELRPIASAMDGLASVARKRGALDQEAEHHGEAIRLLEHTTSHAEVSDALVVPTGNVMDRGFRPLGDRTISKMAQGLPPRPNTSIGTDRVTE